MMRRLLLQHGEEAGLRCRCVPAAELQRLYAPPDVQRFRRRTLVESDDEGEEDGEDWCPSEDDAPEEEVSASGPAASQPSVLGSLAIQQQCDGHRCCESVALQTAEALRVSAAGMQPSWLAGQRPPRTLLMLHRCWPSAEAGQDLQAHRCVLGREGGGRSQERAPRRPQEDPGALKCTLRAQRGSMPAAPWCGTCGKQPAAPPAASLTALPTPISPRLCPFSSAGRKPLSGAGGGAGDPRPPRGAAPPRRALPLGASGGARCADAHLGAALPAVPGAGAAGGGAVCAGRAGRRGWVVDGWVGVCPCMGRWWCVLGGKVFVWLGEWVRVGGVGVSGKAALVMAGCPPHHHTHALALTTTFHPARPTPTPTPSPLPRRPDGVRQVPVRLRHPRHRQDSHGAGGDARLQAPRGAQPGAALPVCGDQRPTGALPRARALGAV